VLALRRDGRAGGLLMAAAKPKPAPEPEPEAPICPECWPDGWPALDCAAMCEHGKWSRPDPAAS
jgi:hypothetical protein